MMKKIALAVALAVSLAACSDEKPTVNCPDKQSSAEFQSLIVPAAFVARGGFSSFGGARSFSAPRSFSRPATPSFRSSLFSPRSTPAPRTYTAPRVVTPSTPNVIERHYYSSSSGSSNGFLWGLGGYLLGWSSSQPAVVNCD